MKNINPMTACDFYKVSHLKFYPKGTELVYSNFTPRSNKRVPQIEGVDNKVTFFGLQYFIKWFLMDEFENGFFKQPKDRVIARYKRRMDTSLGKDSVDTAHIAALHDLGYLPISIRALPEGESVNEKVPMLVIYNTKPEFFWVTNYLETVLSCMLWKTCTSATTARKYKQIGLRFAKETGVDTSFVQYQNHDFSYRGLSCVQDAAMTGMAHLINFVGTDSISAIDALEEYYNADAEKELIGCSVPASEHSCCCMGGKEGEFETFKRYITESYPTGIVSLVSDTWDYWQIVTDFLPRLKEIILKRDGKVVIRPDSSPKTPYEIICGDLDAPVGSAEYKGTIECLWETFGGSVNEAGYKVLHPTIGCIYGEAITPTLAKKIFEGLKAKGFASSNIVYGIGSMSFTLTTRDHHSFAIKATAGKINGKTIEIFKDPKTDGASIKKSARGFISVTKDDTGEYVAKDQVSWEESENCELKEVFRDGKLLIETSLQDIRGRIDSGIV